MRCAEPVQYEAYLLKILIIQTEGKQDRETYVSDI